MPTFGYAVLITPTGEMLRYALHDVLVCMTFFFSKCHHKKMRNVVPSPTVLLTSMRPPWFCTMRLTR